MHRWDQRFAVSPSKDNLHYHEFYRQYFDKPSGRKLLTVLPRTRTSTISLRTTFGYGFQRMPAWSKAVSRRNKKKERQWDERFNVLWSKDNEHFHKATREYFDRRKEVNDLKSDRSGLPEAWKTGTVRSMRSTHRSAEGLARATWSGAQLRTASQ